MPKPPADFILPMINPRKKTLRPTYGPGKPSPGLGRRPGQVNKLTRDIKQGIVDAATNVGRDGSGEGGLVGFLEDLATNHKKAFASLLGKVLPLQINAGAMVQTIGTVNVISVPADHYLSAEDMRRLNLVHEIEHAPEFIEQD